MGRKRSGTEDHSKPGLQSPFSSYGGRQNIGGFWIRNLELGSRSYIIFAAMYSAKKFLDAFREGRDSKNETLEEGDFEVRCLNATKGDYSVVINDKVIISWTGGQIKMRDIDAYKYKPEEAKWELPPPYEGYVKRLMGEARSKEFVAPIKRERVSREGLTSIGEICDELKIDPREARAYLRRNEVEKPAAGWAWADDELEKVRKLLRKIV